MNFYKQIQILQVFTYENKLFYKLHFWKWCFTISVIDLGFYNAIIHF